MVATTKATWGENCTIASVAAAKAWIQAMHTNLLACGLVQTTDTGQLDIASISAIPATGGYFGSLLYRFNDTKQSDKPVIIKLRPYVGSYGGANSAGLAVTIGFATDGAGNITGSNSGEFNVFNSGTGTQRSEPGVSTPCYAIHGEGHFSMLLHLGRVQAAAAKQFPLVYLGIARTMDSSGSFTSDGVYISRLPVAYEANTNIGPSTMRLQKARLDSALSTWRQDLSPWVGGADAASANGKTQLQRTYLMKPAIVSDPIIATYWAASIVTGDELDISVDGVTRHYLAIGANAGLVADTVNANSVGFAMLWGDL